MNGFVLASWIPHVPMVKAAHGLNEAALGLAAELVTLPVVLGLVSLACLAVALGAGAVRPRPQPGPRRGIQAA